MIQTVQAKVLKNFTLSTKSDYQQVFPLGNQFFYLNEMRVNVELVGGDLVKSLAHSEHAACNFRLMA